MLKSATFDAPRNHLVAQVQRQGSPALSLLDQPASTAAPKAIEMHLHSFFDRDRDRKISYGEAFFGLHELGVGWLGAAAAAFGINAGLGKKTQGSFLTVNLDHITDGIHGADSDILNKDGETVRSKIDRMFSFSKTYPNALTRAELGAFMAANRAQDPNAPIAEKAGAFAEWALLFRFTGETRPSADGPVRVISRDLVERFFSDEHLFNDLSKRHQAMREARSGTFSGAVANFFNTWVF